MIIRRVGVLSAAKIGAALGLAIGLIAGVVMFLISSLSGLGAAAGAEGAGGMIMGMGALALIVLPLMYGVFGFIGGALQAFVFNIAAGLVGGLVVETE